MAVDADYETQVAAIKREYEQQLAEIEKQRGENLKQVLDFAMDSRNLDLANQANAAIDGKQATTTATSPASTDSRDFSELRHAIEGKRFMWGRDVLRFNENGFVSLDNWDERGLVTSWKCIDRRTVLLRIERGRTQDVLAVLTFNDEIDHYTSIDFVGGVTPNNKRVR